MEADSVLQRHAIKCYSENHEQQAKANPMAVCIHLAHIHEASRSGIGERGLRLGHPAFSCTHETGRERGTKAVERLMLNEHGIINSIAHAPGSQREATDDQELARRGHDLPPTASSLPVYRQIPTSIASSAMITSSPPISANPPASKPKRSSSSTNTGRASEPINNVIAQIRFQRSR